MCFIPRYILLTTLLFLAWHLQAYSTTTQTRGQAETGTNDVTYIDIDEQKDDAISVGKRMLKAQMFNKALVHLNAALANCNEVDICCKFMSVEEDPRNYEAYFLRAMAHLLLSPSQRYPAKAHTEANNDLDQSIRINPRFTAAFALRGFLYLKQGQLAKAKRDFKEIKRIEPINVKDLAYLQTLEPVAAELEHSIKLYTSLNSKKIMYLLTKALVKKLAPLNQNVLSFVQTLQQSVAQTTEYKELFKTVARHLIYICGLCAHMKGMVEYYVKAVKKINQHWTETGQKSRKYTKEIEFLVLETLDRMSPKMERAIQLALKQDYHEAINVFVQALDEFHDLYDKPEVSTFLENLQNVLTAIGDALDDIIELYKKEDYKQAIMLLLETMLGAFHLEPKLGQYLQQFVQQLEPDLDDAINLFFVENDFQRACYLFVWSLMKKIPISNQQLIEQFESRIETYVVGFHHSIITYTKLFSQWESIYKLSKTIVKNFFDLSQPAVLQYLKIIQLLTAQIEQAKLLYNEQDYQGAIHLLSNAIDKELDATNEEVAIYLQYMQLLVAEFEYAIIMFGKPNYIEDINLLHMVLLRRLYHFNQEASRNLQTIEHLSEITEDANALIIRRDYKGAISLLSIAINISQWDLHLFEMRAECYATLGNVRGARLDINSSLHLLNSHDSKFALKVAALFNKGGNIASTLDIIKLCLEHYPEDTKCQQLHEYFKKLEKLLRDIDNLSFDKEWDDCVNQANEILQMEPTLPFVLNALSHKCHCLTQGGYSFQAQMICSEVLEMDPNNTNALCDKAYNFIANKHYHAALAMFWHALDIDNTNKRANKGIQHIKKLLKYSTKRNYYEILGVERNANKKQVEKAYTKLSIKWNPNRFNTEAEKKLAETNLMDIAAAKEVLTYQIVNNWYFEDMDMDELDDEL